MARKTNAEWWKEPETISVAENTNAKQRRRRFRFARVYIWAAVILFPLALFTTLVLANRELSTASEGAGDNRTYASQDAALAQLELEQWIAQVPSPLPGGRVISFNGSTTKTPQPENPGDVVDYVLTTFEFVVADRGGNLFGTTMQMSVSAQGTVQVAEPALIPIPPAEEGTSGARWPWPGVEQGSSNAAYESAVDAWAKAYTSGNPAILKQTVGDPQEDRAYLPLSGVTFNAVSIGQVGDLWADDQDRAEEDRPRQALLRVTVQAAWVGQTAGNQRAYPEVTFDLLVDQADTAAPTVVAWGSPGTDLEPYSNAVTGRKLVVAQPSQTPQPSQEVPPSPSETDR